MRFATKTLDRLEVEANLRAGYSQAVVRAYRKVLQLIRAAEDERTFYALRSLRYEKLKGKRSHQRSMRLNEQWRLIVELKEERSRIIVEVIGIEDYH